MQLGLTRSLKILLELSPVSIFGLIGGLKIGLWANLTFITLFKSHDND